MTRIMKYPLGYQLILQSYPLNSYPLGSSTAYFVTFYESPPPFTFVISNSDISSPGRLVILTSVQALRRYVAIWSQSQLLGSICLHRLYLSVVFDLEIV